MIVRFTILLFCVISFNNLRSATGHDSLALASAGSTADSIAIYLSLFDRYYPNETADAIEVARMASSLAQRSGNQKLLAKANYDLANGLIPLNQLEAALEIANENIDRYRELGDEYRLVAVISQKGTILRKMYRLDEALVLFNEANALFNSIAPPAPVPDSLQKMRINGLNNVGIIFLLQSRLDTALVIYKHLLRETPENDLQNRLYINGNISRIYQRLGDFDSALVSSHKTLEIASKMNQLGFIALSYNQIGSIYYDRGEYASALENFRNALTIRRKTGIKADIASSYNNIASVFEKTGQYDSSVTNFLRAVRIKQELGDRKSLAVTYGNIGMIYLDWGDTTNAVRYYKRSLNTNKDLGNLQGMAWQHTSLGNVFKASGISDSALYHFGLAMRFSDSISDKQAKMQVLFNLGDVYFDLDELNKALSHYNKATNLATEMDARFWMATGDIALGRIALRKGKPANAIRHLKQSLQYGEESNTWDIISESNLYLSKAFEKNGDLAKAMTHYKAYTQNKDSVFNADKARIISEMKTKYETEIKEKENQALRKDNEIQKLTISKNHELIISMTIGIMATILLLIAIFVLYRKRTIAYKNLVAKNLELANCDKKILEKGGFFPENTKEETNEPEDEQMQKERELVLRFNKYLSDEKPFLYSQISIEDVSAALNTNRTYLSKAINSVFNRSFNTIINEMRVRAARQMLADKKLAHISVEGIGEMAGYNSRIVFARNFKKITGLTPSYFRESALKQLH